MIDLNAFFLKLAFYPCVEIAILKSFELYAYCVFRKQLCDLSISIEFIGCKNEDRRWRWIGKISAKQLLAFFLKCVAIGRCRNSDIRYFNDAAHGHHWELLCRSNGGLDTVLLIQAKFVKVKIA